MQGAGTTLTAVPVFTDHDLAARFLERAGSPPLKPFTCPTREGLAAVFEKLLEVGETHLGFEPVNTALNLFPRQQGPADQRPQR